MTVPIPAAGTTSSRSADTPRSSSKSANALACASSPASSNVAYGDARIIVARSAPSPMPSLVRTGLSSANPPKERSALGSRLIASHSAIARAVEPVAGDIVDPSGSATRSLIGPVALPALTVPLVQDGIAKVAAAIATAETARSEKRIMRNSSMEKDMRASKRDSERPLPRHCGSSLGPWAIGGPIVKHRLTYLPSRGSSDTEECAADPEVLSTLRYRAPRDVRTRAGFRLHLLRPNNERAIRAHG